MRRFLVLVAMMVLVQVTASGCRHVAGACDCDHAPAAGAPATINAPVVMPAGPAIPPAGTVIPPPIPK